MPSILTCSKPNKQCQELPLTQSRISLIKAEAERVHVLTQFICKRQVGRLNGAKVLAFLHHTLCGLGDNNAHPDAIHLRQLTFS